MWADEYRMLSAEASAEQGQWRTDRAPYLRGVMDAFSDPYLEEVVGMFASQTGKTECILNVIGFHIDQDPGPILVVLPNIEPFGKNWSRLRLAPMIRDTPSIRERVSDPKGRSPQNTILAKAFPGGYIFVVGASSPASLAMYPIRILLFDEVDKYPVSTGGEGDPIGLAKKRTQTFYNRRIGMFSTPKLKGESRIEEEWEKSDKRRYHVPCPECGELQPLRWRRKDELGNITAGLVWDRDKEGNHRPETVKYQCAECGELIDEVEKFWMLSQGEWIAEVPGERIAGFHLNALYSPWVRWEAIVREFLEVKDDPEGLQVFVNEILAETWEERGERPDAESLEARRERYTDTEGNPVEVPNGVGILTAGVDIQADRLELLVKGWGAREESWLIKHYRIHGDPERDATWERLENLLTRGYRHASGIDLWIQCCMIDSGYLIDPVYKFVRPREPRNVFASKGVDRAAKEPVTRATKRNSAGIRLWTIGTVALKDTIFSRLKIRQPGPRYMHFGYQEEDGADANYFKQFEAEKLIRQLRGGRIVRSYKQVQERNEAIDLEVLALAALHALGPGIRERLGEYAEKAAEGVKIAGQGAPRGRWKKRRQRSRGVD